MLNFFRSVILGCFFSFAFQAAAQKTSQSNKTIQQFALGAEVQWYPAGLLMGPAVMYFHRPKHVFFGKLGINVANRHNWSGLNDNEEGIGYGGSLGYRYLFKANSNSFFIGTRGELYSTSINWQNNIGQPSETKGVTKIFVYQPSIEIGYLIQHPERKWLFVFSGGIGQEINIVTRGKPVGEGGMWLLQASVFYKL